LKVPSYYKDQAVIIGGKPQKETYGEFQAEMDMFNKAFFEVMMEGDAKGRVFTFPIPTYNITKDFDWDNPELKNLWEMTAKYGIPYFSNFVNSDMNPEDARSMCCRLRIDNRELQSRGGGLFGANPLTGSIGVVTINMPRLGYTSKTEEEFKEKLGRLMDLAKDSLEIKRKILETLTEKNLYPYAKYYLRNIKARFDQYWKNHFGTIGLVGMNEAAKNLMGKNITEKEGMDFAVRIMNFMRDRLQKYQEETGSIYNLEATPAEGTSFRLASKDKIKYPEIIVANEEEYQKGAHPFYTNSTQLPVNHTDDIFEAMELQDNLQTKYTGGTVMHLFVGEKINSVESVKNMVKKICNTYKLPYFTFSPTFSVCPSHGYIVGEHFECPTCKAKTEVYSRVVGYLRPVQQWNHGKKAEFGMRKTFKVSVNEEEPVMQTTCANC
jgi:ribonucleoside-triphosphate reductase